MDSFLPFVEQLAGVEGLIWVDFALSEHSAFAFAVVIASGYFGSCQDFSTEPDKVNYSILAGELS